MKKVPTLAILLLIFVISAGGGCDHSAIAQNGRVDLYRCEGCEAIHERPLDDLDWQTTIPPEGEPGEPLILTGIVYHTDGTTPAAGVIVYSYHTNEKGIYPTRGDETGWARRHGYLRGWVQSDQDGRYRFRTIKPGSYPGRNAPAHIHMTVKEPERKEYWIDAVEFKGDPHLEERPTPHPRGGAGIVALTRDADGVWAATRDIILERHPKQR